MSLVLSGTDGLSDIDGSAATPAIRGTDTNTGIFFPAADTIAFSEGGAESMRIDSAGDVGIGTTSPSYKLHVVNAAGGDTIVLDNGGGAGDGASTYLAFSGTNTGANFVRGRIRGAFPDATGGGLAFETGTSGSMSERMRIDSSGNLLVGTTSSDITAVGIRLMNNNQLQTSKSGDWSFRMGRRDSTGIITEIYYNSSRVGDIATNGTGTTYNSASDYRLKENIQPMTGALARNALLNPVKYKWKVDGSDGEGFIADQLQGPFPSAVTGEKDAVDADGNPIYQSIGTGPLDGHFAACVNELQAIIQEQQALITALTTRITALEAA